METLYSLCARHHRVAGNASAKDTQRQLFGPLMAGRPMDPHLPDDRPSLASTHRGSSAPGGIEALAARAEGTLGQPHEILMQRTLFPTYRAFMAPAAAQRAQAGMLGGSAQGLRFALGMSLVRAKPAHPLRACAICEREDRAAHGVAYWHRDHQWPGVHRCQLHSHPLHTLYEPGAVPATITWILPATSTPAASAPSRSDAMQPTHPARSGMQAARARETYPCRGDKAEARLMKIADIAKALGSHTAVPGVFDSEILSRLYLAAMRERGLGTGIGRRIRDGDAGACFVDFYAAIPSSRAPGTRGTPADGPMDSPHASLGVTARTAPAFETDLAILADFPQIIECLLRLCDARRMLRDPLWHILAIAWLFEDWEEFLDAYRSTRWSHGFSAHGLKALTTAKAVIGAPSMAAGSRQAVWAHIADSGAARAARRLNESERDRATQMLAAGSPTAAVAAALDTSSTQVVRLLRADASLRVRRRTAIQALRTIEVKKEWDKALALCDGRVWRARQIAPAAFTWLYRHDRAHLHLGQNTSDIQPELGRF